MVINIISLNMLSNSYHSRLVAKYYITTIGSYDEWHLVYSGIIPTFQINETNVDNMLPSITC